MAVAIKLQNKPSKLKPINLQKSKRSSLPKLLRDEINWVRLKFHENICLQLLQTGYHNTFSEIYNLITIQNIKRNEPSEELRACLEKPLMNRKKFLSKVIRYLMEAEEAQIVNQWPIAYIKNLCVAYMFRKKKSDDWISKYYLKKCLHIAQSALISRQTKLFSRDSTVVFAMTDSVDPNQESKPYDVNLLEKVIYWSRYRIASSMASTGQYQEAINLFQKLYDDLKVDSRDLRVPMDDPELEFQEECIENAVSNAAPLVEAVCQNISNCILECKTFSGDGSNEKQLENTLYALEMAQKSNNEETVGACKYDLGRLYLEINDFESAQQSITECFDLSQKTGNLEYQMNSCQLLVEIYRRRNDFENVKLYAQKYVDLAKSSEQPNRLANAHCLLAKIESTETNEFENSQIHAYNGFQTVQTRANQNNVNQLRIWCGIADAKRINNLFVKTLVASQMDDESLQNLINWRNIRKPLPIMTEETYASKTKQTFQQTATEMRNRRSHKIIDQNAS